MTMEAMVYFEAAAIAEDHAARARRVGGAAATARAAVSVVGAEALAGGVLDRADAIALAVPGLVVEERRAARARVAAGDDAPRVARFDVEAFGQRGRIESPGERDLRVAGAVDARGRRDQRRRAG